MECLSAPFRAARGVKNECTHCGSTMYSLGIMDKMIFLWDRNRLGILNEIRIDRLSQDYSSFVFTEFPTSCHTVNGSESIFHSKILAIRSLQHSIPLYLRVYVSSIYVHYTHFSRRELPYLILVDILQNSNFLRRSKTENLSFRTVEEF